MPETTSAAAGGGRLEQLARASIAHGLRSGEPLVPELDDGPDAWREPAAVFVTLRDAAGELRGCVGSLEATEPLATAVAGQAFRAAVCDPRCEPLRREELNTLDIHISVLSPLERIDAASEAELVAALRPGSDGLVLRDGPCSATFLPAVWKQVPDARRFVHALQQKAGLALGHWTRDTQAWRYTVRDVG